MSGNTFGRLFRLTTFGESHGPGLGGIVDGCPSGIPLSEEDMQKELDRRRPGQGGPAATARKEPDRIRIMSGVFEGMTTGTPIGFIIENTDQRSRDYGEIMDVWRPGHADFGYDQKYFMRDYRGGGRSSGRETVSRVAGGAVAQALLAQHGIVVRAYPVELGGIPADVTDPDGAMERPYFSPDPDVVDGWESLIADVKADGDTLGGIVQVDVQNMPTALGEPVFDKLDAMLAHAMMSVGAVKGVEIGDGFSAARARGSENNDPILPDGFMTNHAGGIIGGISTSQPLIVRAAIKPIPSIAKPQQTITRYGEEKTVRIGGRHDICAIPRIVPVLKSMVALTLADAMLLHARQGYSPLDRPDVD